MPAFKNSLNKQQIEQCVFIFALSEAGRGESEKRRPTAGPTPGSDS